MSNTPDNSAEKKVLFSPTAKAVLSRADDFAKARGNAYVGTGHLFYGLVTGDPENPYVRLFADKGITGETMPKVFDKILPMGESARYPDEPSLATPAVRNVMNDARQQASQRGSLAVEPLDLLKTLFEKRDAVAGKIVAGFGFDIEELETEIQRIQ